MSSVRQFETGATRNNDKGRDDPEGYLSPLALDRFFQYMTKHRIQSDGSIRASDNWQRGIPLETYMKSLWRHFFHLWQRHRGYEVRDPHAGADICEDLCAILFNAQGYLHEVIKEREKDKNDNEPFRTMFEPWDVMALVDGADAPRAAPLPAPEHA